jgi:hypothetical protein
MFFVNHDSIFLSFLLIALNIGVFSILPNSTGCSRNLLALLYQLTQEVIKEAGMLLLKQTKQITVVDA